MREHRPDVVLLTPLLRLGSSQIEVLRSARANGARSISDGPSIGAVCRNAARWPWTRLRSGTAFALS